MAELITSNTSDIKSTDITLTNPEDIINATKDIINKFHESFSNLYSAAISFNNQYEKYISEAAYDSSMLKQRMKDVINMAVPDDTI